MLRHYLHQYQDVRARRDQPRPARLVNLAAFSARAIDVNDARDPVTGFRSRRIRSITSCSVTIDLAYAFTSSQCLPRRASRMASSTISLRARRCSTSMITCRTLFGVPLWRGARSAVEFGAARHRTVCSRDLASLGVTLEGLRCTGESSSSLAYGHAPCIEFTRQFDDSGRGEME
jgi:hypothetical protein